MSNSLKPHGLQHVRPHCPSPTPRVYSNLCPLTQWCHPTISSSAIPFSSIFNLSQHQGSFRWVSSLHQVVKVLEFNNSPSNEHPGLISFKINWLDLLTVQGTLKSLLQHHSSKASLPQCSAFFLVQLSHPYMTAGKTIALTRWTFVGKVLSLLFNILSRLVITFLPRSKRVLISMAAVTICRDFGAPQNKVCHCLECFLIYLPWSDGTRCHDLCFLNIEL